MKISIKINGNTFYETEAETPGDAFMQWWLAGYPMTPECKNDDYRTSKKKEKRRKSGRRC
jgi:hypothetical protein